MAKFQMKQNMTKNNKPHGQRHLSTATDKGILNTIMMPTMNKIANNLHNFYAVSWPDEKVNTFLQRLIERKLHNN